MTVSHRVPAGWRQIIVDLERHVRVVDAYEDADTGELVVRALFEREGDRRFVDEAVERARNTEKGATMGDLEHAIADLAERFAGEKIEIIQLFDIAWSGWECDSAGALIMRTGEPDLVIVDQTGGDDRPVQEILAEKVQDYRRLAVETEGVLDRYRKMGGHR